jgi:hypothetical protein
MSAKDRGEIMKQIVEDLKGFEWEFISIKPVRKKLEFKGAVARYDTDDTDLSVAFSTTDAFIISDDQGAFTCDDYTESVFKTMDISRIERIDGVTLFGVVDDETSEVNIDTESFEEWGIHDSAIIEDIKARLTVLARLNEKDVESAG